MSPDINAGGVEEHAEVGQQRVHALSIGRRDGQFLEGIRHESGYGQEEGLNHHQHGGGVGKGVPHLFRGKPQGQGRQD